MLKQKLKNLNFKNPYCTDEQNQDPEVQENLSREPSQDRAEATQGELSVLSLLLKARCTCLTLRETDSNPKRQM